MADTIAGILRGKSILITGASGGLGHAVTRAFLDAGALVSGTARKWTPDETPAGTFHAINADLTQSADCANAVQAAIAHGGRLDAVVHLMGGFAGGSPLETTEEATWDQMMNINLRAAFLTIRAALIEMRKTSSGRIIAVGARAGVEPAAGIGAYSVSKAALHALIRSIAAETKGTAITANALLPSTIDTEANRKAMPKADFSKWVSPESLAGTLLWLASDASRDISGALIPAYGGA